MKEINTLSQLMKSKPSINMGGNTHDIYYFQCLSKKSKANVIFLQLASQKQLRILKTMTKKILNGDLKATKNELKTLSKNKKFIRRLATTKTSTSLLKKNHSVISQLVRIALKNENYEKIGLSSSGRMGKSKKLVKTKGNESCKHSSKSRKKPNTDIEITSENEEEKEEEEDDEGRKYPKEGSQQNTSGTYPNYKERNNSDSNSSETEEEEEEEENRDETEDSDSSTSFEN